MGGDPEAQPVGESTAQMLQSYIQGLPGLIQATNAQTLPTAQSNLAATQAVSGPTNALAAQLIGQYAPGLAQLGSNISDQTAQAGGQTTANVLNSSGQNVATAEQGIDQSVNPEYYATRSLASSKLSDLLNSINLNGLSGGESAAVERGLNIQNQNTGNVNVPSAINTVSNAMGYGAGLDAKRSALSSALQTATSFLPASVAAINPISDTLAGAAAGSSTANNVGLQQFQGVQQNPGSSATGTANNLLTQIGGLTQQQNDINAQRRDSLDRTTGVLGSLPSIS